MITYISGYLYPSSKAPPYVAIHRYGSVRFYDLTRASSERLARAIRKLKGTLRIDAQGWSWRRRA